VSTPQGEVRWTSKWTC